MTLNRVNTKLLLERVTLHTYVLKKMLGEHHSHAQHERAELVNAMREAREHHTLQQIADAAGISKQRVSQLLNKEEK